MAKKGAEATTPMMEDRQLTPVDAADMRTPAPDGTPLTSVTPPPPSTSAENTSGASQQGEKTSVEQLAAMFLEVVRGLNPTAKRYNFELPIFSGQISEWLYFKRAFLDSVHSYSDAENIARLRKALKGDAMEAVKCLFLGSSTATEIIHKLEMRFGRPHALITYELEKLRHLSKLIDTPREICLFASKVINIITTVQTIGKFEYLYSPELLNAVIDKLTPILRCRWYDYELQADQSLPGLLILKHFLEKEADLNARHAKAEVLDGPRRQNRFESRVHTTMTDSERGSGVCTACGTKGHYITTCPTFTTISVNERWDIARKNKLCFRCLRKRKWQHRCKGQRCAAPGCAYYHHRLLHGGYGDPRQQQTSPIGTQTRDTSGHAHDRVAAPSQSDREQPHAAAVASAWAPRGNRRTLLKVLPVTVAGPLGKVDTYALLDDGSTVTLLTSDTARRIGVKGPSEPFYIEGVGGTSIDAGNSQRVTINIRGRHLDTNLDVVARTIDRLNISSQSVPTAALADCAHLIDIADELVYDLGTPTLLIGQDNWDLLIASEVRRGSNHQPVASRTPLGWVLHGQSCYYAQTAFTRRRERCTHVSSDAYLEQLLKEHFSIESLGVEPRSPRTDQDTKALKILEDTTRPLPDGGYETGLLWKEEGKAFPNNYDDALIRLEGIERRFKRDPVLKDRYVEQMTLMIDNGYAERAPMPPLEERTWYLPHFPVLSPSKPGKVRIVHDAAARTKGVCLNDYLLTGPDLLQSLIGVLMRFRQRKVAVTADIKDMFLRIQIRAQDRDALRFLWRENGNTSPIEYRMKALLFGAASSPSTAIYVKDYNARRHAADKCEAVNPILRNHYMDDYLHSFDNVEDAIRVSRAVDEVHRRGNFMLQKWASNEPAAVAALAAETPTREDVPLSEEKKVLGLVWRTTDDTLSFNFRGVRHFYNSNNLITKRHILKVTMSLYDPLGLATPVTVQAKRILQDTWRSRVAWDTPLTGNLKEKWDKWIVVLHQLKSVSIPRCLVGYSESERLELHTFVDASEHSYAAVIYWRAIDKNGIVSVSLAAAKGRVAPVRTVSIPRLELQAAVLGGRLAQTVAEEHDLRPQRRVFWTDSRTVLAWLRAGARSFKPFVAHRVAELEETTAATGAEWRWVPSALNCADDATRDVPRDLSADHRWFRGPQFLYHGETSWPCECEPLDVTTTGEERVTTATTANPCHLREALPDIARFSSWTRLIRSTGRILQFIDRCRAHTTAATRQRTRQNPTNDPEWKKERPASTRAPTQGESLLTKSPTRATHVLLPAEYAQRAEHLWVRASQEDSFAVELGELTGGRAIPNHSRLRQLSLIVDSHGTLRLRSRIAAAAGVPEEGLAPAVLDGKHRYSRLYIDAVHQRLHHSGVECVTNEVRQHYWILRLRPTVRTVIKGCQRCRLRRATPPEPLTGNHPECRLSHHHRPFTHVGWDYFGPLSVTTARRHEKRYVALFTCLTTRAVHLELAASLSSDAAILALRRMMARRGCPETIWSDNGTNFKGADAELRKAALQSSQQEADVRHIKWNFIPPGAPLWAARGKEW